jgi:predicted RNA methylase
MADPLDDFFSSGGAVAEAKRDPTRDPLDSYFADETRQKADLALTATRDANSDTAARANVLARNTGLPPETVDRNLNTVARQAQVTHNRRIVESNPKLATWASDPRHAAVAQDDLSAMAKVGQIFDNIGGSIKAGMATGAAGIYDFARAGLEIADPFNYAADLLTGDTAARRNAGSIAMLNRARQSSLALADASRPKNQGFVAQSLYSGLESIPTMVLSGAAAVAGSPTAGLTLLGIPTAGQGYGQARDAGQSPAAAAVFGAGQGGIEIATEAAPFKFLTESFGKIGAGKFIAGFLGREITGEEAATTLQSANEWAALHPGTSFAEWAKTLPKDWAATALGVLALAGVTHGAHISTIAAQNVMAAGDRVLKRRDAVAQAKADAGFLDALAKGATETKAQKRDPSAFAKFLALQTDGSPVETIYAPAEIVRQLYQDNYASPTDPANDPLFGFVPDMARQLEQAAATGGDVAIPTAGFVAHHAGTPVWEALKNDIRASLDGLSLNEAKAMQSAAASLDKAQLDAAALQDAIAAADRVPAQLVRADIEAKLQAAGYAPDRARAMAAITATAYETRAARLARGGATETAQTLYSRDGFTIERQGKDGVIRTAPTPTPAAEQVEPQGSPQSDAAAPAPLSDPQPANVADAPPAPAQPVDLPETTLSSADAAPTMPDIAPAVAEAATEQPSEAPNERVTIARAFGADFVNGRAFANINDARARVAEIIGRPIKSGTADAKMAEEAIELGVVLASRTIVQRGGSSPREVYDRLVALYGQQPKLATRTSTSVEQQAYSTPVPLAYLAALQAGIDASTTVYEPSAGNGALLITASPGNVQANELNPDRAAQLAWLMDGANVTTEDASRYRPARIVDAVITNPPFGVLKDPTGASQQFDVGGFVTSEIDHAIALKALETMADHGRAVLIIGGINKLAATEKARSDAYNGKAKRNFFYRLYGNYNVVDHFTVAGEMYEKQGAGWPVDVIVIDGRHKSALPLPAAAVPRIYSDWEALADALEPKRSTRRPEPPGIQGDGGSEPGRAGGRNVGDAPQGDGSGADRNPGGRPDAQGNGGVSGEAADGQPAGAGVGDTPASNGVVAGNDRPDGVGGRGGDDPVAPLPTVARPIVAPPAPLADLPDETPSQTPYKPASNGKGLSTLVPTNMAAAVQDSLAALSAKRGDLDAYVADALGYAPDRLADYFSAEQIDALALALDNMDKGAGFILGDQTGIGKGRVVAGVLRYAMRNKITPIFVTEKPNLYGDMYRDLTDIGIQEMLGREINILMTNAGSRVPLDEAETVMLRTPDAKRHNETLMSVARDGLGDFDVVFTNYSQMQALKQEETDRQKALKQLADGAILVLDESHNAGGQADGRKKKDAGPDRATLARAMVEKAKGVLFSSATYAKRPDVMDLYAATDIRFAVKTPAEIGPLIERGGVPLQQAVAAMLAKAGQYVRRERSFAGISYATMPVPVSRAAYDNFSTALRSIAEFEATVVKPIKDDIKEDIKANAEAISADGSTGGAGIASTNFTSVIHNLVSQMLLSIKAEDAAQRAIAAIKAGERPVLTVANTMGSFIGDYTSEAGIKPGGALDIDFRQLLARYLDRTRRYTVKLPDGQGSEQHYISDAELGPRGLDEFNRIKALVATSDLGALPLSPIDWIRMRIEEAGYSVDEITGRSDTIDYSGKVPTYKVRDAKSTTVAGKRSIISRFNSGKLDAIILNQSGSTGLSLHASEKFKDKRPRRMFIVQAELNIDTHMQMLGRINRTGQVVLPSYEQLVADVPAEKRPAAVLAKKMASLNANTTAARGSAVTSTEVLDFMNEIGDEVAAAILAADEPLNHMLGDIVSLDDEGNLEGENGADGVARKFTGRIPLLPIAEQEAIYAMFEANYRETLEQLIAAGENPLEAETLDLQPTLIEAKEVADSIEGNASPFASAVTMERVSARRLGKPLGTADVLKMIADAHGLAVPEGEPVVALGALAAAARRQMEPIITQARADHSAYVQVQGDSMENVKAAETFRAAQREIAVAFGRNAELLTPGNQVILKSDGGNLHGVVLSFTPAGKAKNPIAPSQWKARVAVLDGGGTMTIPLSKIGNGAGQFDIAPSRGIMEGAVIEAFDKMKQDRREERTLMTGNLLRAYSMTAGAGRIVNIRYADGAVRPALLMRRGYDYAKEQARLPVALSKAEDIAKVIDSGVSEVVSGEGALSIRKRSYNDRGYGDYVIEAAAAKAVGGQFYLSAAVRNVVGDFVKRGSNMVATITARQLGATVTALQDAGARFEARRNLDQVRTLIGTKGFQQSARGRIDIADGHAVIRLMADADESTFMHEMGHLFLEQMWRDADGPNATPDLIADRAAIAAWFASNGHAIAADGSIPTEAHELWARGWERYLMEGKAPTTALRQAFEAFRGWLTRIYKAVAGLNVPINDDIRRVMDRMLAAEDSLSAATETGFATPVLTDPASAGMSDAVFGDYQRLADEARGQAKADLLAKAMRSIRAQRTADYRDERNRVRDEIEREVNSDPVMKALHLLRTGKWLGEPERPTQRLRLSRIEVTRIAGDDVVDALPKAVPPILDDERNPVGLHPDAFAELVAASSGKALIDGLVAIRAQEDMLRAQGDKRSYRHRLIDEKTDAIMAERRGDYLTDAAIEKEARDALATEKQGELYAAELRALTRATGDPKAPPATPFRIVREWARAQVRAGLAADYEGSKDAARHAVAAAKAGRAAFDALAAGDRTEAALAKQRQMIAHALHMEAKAAHEAVDSALGMMRRMARRDRAGSIDVEWLDRIHQLLEGYGLRDVRGVTAEGDIMDWLVEQRMAGIEVVLPPRTAPVDWQTLTVDELLGLGESIKSLVALGRATHRLFLAGEDAALSDLVASAEDSASRLPDRKLPEERNPKVPARQWAAAGLLKIETLADWLDDNDPNGAFNRVLIAPATDAQNRKSELQEQVLLPIARAYLEMPAAQRARLDAKLTLPLLPDHETGRPTVMTGMDLLAVALNTGNESNMAKLVAGERWSAEAIDATLAEHLTLEDWQFVQTIWTQLETLWPDIVATERLLRGVTPEKVVPRVVSTVHGEFEGGYYPVVFDRRRSDIADKPLMDDTAAIMDAIGPGVATSIGHTITRTGAAAPLLLSLEPVLLGHVHRVVNRIAFAPFVRDTLRFIRTPAVQRIVRNHAGQAYLDQIMPWLRRQVTDGLVDQQGAGFWNNIARKARVNVSMVGMGLRWTTGVAQVAGLTSSANIIGAQWLGSGIKELAISRGVGVEFVLNRSPEMARRNQEFERDVRDFFAGLGERPRGLDKVRALAFWHIAMIDRYVVAIPTWLGAYRKAASEGMSEDEAASYADKAVRTSQGSGRIKDQAAIQAPNSEALKLFTMFYSYFNVQFNEQWKAQRLARGGRKGDYHRAMAISWWILVAAPLAGALLTGDWPTEDEDWAHWLSRTLFFNLFSSVPVIREASSYLNRMAGGLYAQPSATPAQRAIESTVKSGSDLWNLAHGEDVSDQWVKHAIETPGYFLGLPTGQAASTGQFLWDVQQGDQQPETIADWYRGLTKGKAEAQ